MAPYFAIGMVFFLMLFVAYFVLAVVAIAVDFGAMDVECAEVGGKSFSMHSAGAAVPHAPLECLRAVLAVMGTESYGGAGRGVSAGLLARRRTRGSGSTRCSPSSSPPRWYMPNALL